MTPWDPRHGTYIGYCGIPCHEVCCRAAATRYRKKWALDRIEGRPRVIAALGTQRRVQALAALGWPYATIARVCEMRQSSLARMLEGDRVRARTAVKIAAVYEALCMTSPPENTSRERQAASRARHRAQRNGWPPPLAWDDIDDPSDATTTSVPEFEPALDEAVILRVLSGESLSTTRMEKDEIVRRWVASGRSEGSLCSRLGWKEGRYGRAPVDGGLANRRHVAGESECSHKSPEPAVTDPGQRPLTQGRDRVTSLSLPTPNVAGGR